MTEKHHMNYRLTKTAFICIAFLFLARITREGSGEIIVTVRQNGNDVIVEGGGTINTAGLIKSLGISDTQAGINPMVGSVALGAIDSVASDLYSGPEGPSEFGLGGSKHPESGVGDTFGIGTHPLDASRIVAVPAGYQSGSELVATTTYENQTVAALGLTRGIYTWNWGFGATADSFVVNIVPEPSTLLLVAMAGLGIMWPIRPGGSRLPPDGLHLPN
jgi:hypothetical protein